MSTISSEIINLIPSVKSVVVGDISIEFNLLDGRKKIIYFAPVVQQAETADLKSVKCQFESDQGHQ